MEASEELGAREGDRFGPRFQGTTRPQADSGRGAPPFSRDARAGLGREFGRALTGRVPSRVKPELSEAGLSGARAGRSW